MECDQERSRTLQFLQGSSQNHEAVWQLFGFFAPSVLIYMSPPETRFWFPVLLSVVILGCMVVCATSLVPLGWRVDGSAWAIIFPLAYVDSNLLEIYAANLSGSASSLAAISYFRYVSFSFANEGGCQLCQIDRP